MGAGVDDGEVKRVLGACELGEISMEGSESLRALVEEISPVARIGSLHVTREQLDRMLFHIDRLKPAVSPRNDRARGSRARGPARHRTADRLPELIRLLDHRCAAAGAEAADDNRGWRKSERVAAARMLTRPRRFGPNESSERLLQRSRCSTFECLQLAGKRLVGFPIPMGWTPPHT